MHLFHLAHLHYDPTAFFINVVYLHTYFFSSSFNISTSFADDTACQENTIVF